MAAKVVVEDLYTIECSINGMVTIYIDFSNMITVPCSTALHMAKWIKSSKLVGNTTAIPVPRITFFGDTTDNPLLVIRGEYYGFVSLSIYNDPSAEMIIPSARVEISYDHIKDVCTAIENIVYT